MAKHINDIPYFSQHDNDSDWNSGPWNECSFTCMAMVLAYWGIVGNGSGQLEDQIERDFESKKYTRGNPYHMRDWMNMKYGNIGVNATYSGEATLTEIKGAIVSKASCILHTDLTKSGHIISIVGFDDEAYDGVGALIVNDPWGEWFHTGYDSWKTGKNLYYSYPLMQRVAGPDSNYWLHTVTRE